MINKYQTIYGGSDIVAPSPEILSVYALSAGTIKNVRVKVKTANGSGSTVFNVSKNGVDLFSTELTIASGQTAVSATGLSIAVVFGDILTLKLVSIAAGGAAAPVALQFESEELLILSAADLMQLKTDLALTKSDVGLSNVDNTSDATKNGAAVTLTNKTLTTPTIGSFANANHNHQDSGGGGTLAEAALALTDITTNNVSTSKHGFAPKLPNDSTKYLDGTGAYSVPAGGGGGIWASIFQTTTESRVNTTTLASSTMFTFAVTSGKKYAIRGHFNLWQQSTGTLMKYQFTAPSMSVSASWVRRAGATGGATSTTNSVTPLDTNQTLPAANFIAFEFLGTYIPDSSGTFVFQFAQNSLHATNAVYLLAGSYLEYKEI